jgi:hypothetical protein
MSRNTPPQVIYFVNSDYYYFELYKSPLDIFTDLLLPLLLAGQYIYKILVMAPKLRKMGLLGRSPAVSTEIAVGAREVQGMGAGDGPQSHAQKTNLAHEEGVGVDPHSTPLGSTEQHLRGIALIMVLTRETFLLFLVPVCMFKLKQCN